MLKQVIISAFIFVFLAACGSASIKKVEKSPQTHKEGRFVYDPKGRKEFVFKEISPTLQRFGYSDVCFVRPTRSIAINCLGHKLDYDKYVGKKGYYTGTEPYKDTRNNVASEVVLETGETIYWVTSTRYKHVGNDFIPIEEYNKIKNFKPVPIAPNASVMITGYSLAQTGELMVDSQVNHSYSEKEIEAIRAIAKRYPKNGGKIADLMSTVRVKYDDFDRETIISSMPYNNKGSFISIRIIVQDGKKPASYLIAEYKAEDWLFVEKFSIAADDYRWKSPKINFSRDNAASRIWEVGLVRLNADIKSMLGKASQAQKSTIRFQGKYYDDVIISEKQKKEIANLLQLANYLQ